MEELTLAEWLHYKTESLRNKGLEGALLQHELRHTVWSERHKLLDRSIGEARSMAEAWRIFAECLEQERSALASAPPDMSAPTVRSDPRQ